MLGRARLPPRHSPISCVPLRKRIDNANLGDCGKVIRVFGDERDDVVDQEGRRYLHVEVLLPPDLVALGQFQRR